MKKLLLLILLFILFSCNYTGDDLVNADVSPNAFLSISNDSGDEVCFQLYFNGVNPSSLYGMYKLSGSETFPADSATNILDIFKFVCEITLHKDIPTSIDLMYNPVIGITSLGGGLCSLRSGVLTNILRMNGFYANSYVLEGHVITVVNFEGRNIVLDPDFGVYYFNKNGQIASYDELCSQPNLIVDPINPILDKTAPDFVKAYSEATAALYSSTGDNFILNTGFSGYVDFKNSAFLIPSGANLILPIVPKVNPYRWAFVKIVLPKGVIGNVFAPLLPAAIVGKSRFVFNDKEHFVDSKLFTDLQNLQVGQFEIIENYEGVEIYYFINPSVFTFANNYLLEIKSVYGETPTITQEVNLNSKFYNVGEDLLDSCLSINLQKSLALTTSDSIDDVFETFIDYCEKDTVIGKFFLWDSLKIDYRNIASLRNKDDNYKLENINKELLRRFFSRRFIFNSYFTQ